MNYSKNWSHIRCLLLFFAVCLMTTTLTAQAVFQNFDLDDPNRFGKKQDKDERTYKDKIAKSAFAEVTKQADPKPPRFGGHVGVVIPLVTRGNGTTTTIGENFIIGFPFALTVRTDSPVAFDFEFIPIVNRSSNQDFRFLVHPGIVYGFKKNYAAGIRAAYEFGTGAYGFTPIVLRTFKLTDKTNYFIEADFPVRRERGPNRTRFTSIQFAVHSGISF